MDEEAAGNEDAASDGRWSETSHTLEGAALEDARSYFVNQYRRQLRELCPDQSSRSLASRVGALRRRLSQSCWAAVQGLSTQRLEGTFLQEWSTYEFQVTHTYRPGRGRAEPVD